MHPLTPLGWSDRWLALLADVDPAATPGRVVRDDRGTALVRTADAELRVAVPHHHHAVTGDWVALRDGALLAVLPRAASLVRPRPDTEQPQVLAANVDLVGVVVPLDQPLNRRRLERGLVLAWEGGATPVVLLTKTDLCPDVPAARRAAEQVAVATDVLALSAVTGEGLAEAAALVAPDRTLTLLGASGAGKSSLVNALLDREHLAVGRVRPGDGKGRHTTTRRELVELPGGGAILDTPGLRALTLGVVDEGVDLAFPEIGELAADCRFADCSHTTEPGCAVLGAVADGALDPDRYEGWRRITREAANAALRADKAAYRATTRRWGRMHRDVGRTARR